MVEIEKVMQGLACCQISMGDEKPYFKCDACPYNDISIVVEDCRKQLSQDALQTIEQLVKPVQAELEASGSTWFGVCGECHGIIFTYDRYCKHCGRRIIW